MTAQIVEEMICMDKVFNESIKWVDNIGLSSDEAAFHDALHISDREAKALGEAIPKKISKDLTKDIKARIKIGCIAKECVGTEMRFRIKLLLRKHRYPRDRQDKAVKVNLMQVELMCNGWVAA